MKRIFALSAAAIVALTSYAQDTYLNQHITTTSDVIGSARYVGMGGAMGALGADLSSMTFNPAGMGLYRKNDLSLTFGGQWNKERIDEVNRGKGTFDQMGFVYSINTDNDVCRFFNLSFNYQKKANYNYNFYAPITNMNGLSQMDILGELVSDGYDTDMNLAGKAVDNGYLTPVLVNPNDPNSEVQYYYNQFGGDFSNFTHHSHGSLQGYDINFSTNLKDRVYLGLGLGTENLSYRSWTNYYEENSYVNDRGENVLGDYSLYNDYHINGYGINVKLGGIVRPIEESSFRIGFAVETPTWYRLKSSIYFDLKDEVTGDQTNTTESYLEYTYHNPWKVRASLGSTIGRSFAWDVDYEFANMGGSRMGYPDYDDWNYGGYSTFQGTKDKAMNELTKNTLKSQHTVKVGMEFRPISAFAIRVGYNYISSPFKKNPTFDQYSLDSRAMDFSTSTCYMTTGATNIVTFGLGYSYKHFYADLAYKVRNQKGTFYPFDCTYAQASSNSQFVIDNPQLAGHSVAPHEVDLTRQAITCTLGFKF